MPGRRLALGIWLLLLIACAAVIARTQFRTDMGAFLPRSASMAQQALTEQVNSGAASHLILLAIDNAPPPVLARLSEAMASHLRQQPGFIDVLNGDDKSFANVQDFVWRNRYLLSADMTADRFTAAGLHDALLNDLGLLGSDLGAMIQPTLPSDPTGEMMTLTRQFGSSGGPHSQDGVWVSADGNRALLLVHSAAPGFDIDAQEKALQLIDRDFAAARQSMPGAEAARLLQSGPGVFALHTQETTKRDVTRLSVFATIGAISLLAFAYRSPRVILLGILPVASGAVAAIAVVSLVFGFVHGITLGFGVTLIGESLDYAIYLFTQTSPGDSARETLARIWPTLRLGALTSVAGFTVMLFSNFTGFAQLGLFSIAGLIVAAGVTRFVLPYLVPQSFFAPGADTLSKPLSAAIRHKTQLRWLVAGVVVLGIAGLIFHRGGFWDEDLTDLSPIPAADQAFDQTLRHDLSVPDVRYFAVFKTDSEQQALQTGEALAVVLNEQVARRHLTGFDVPSTILPSDRTQRARQAALPDATTLKANFDQAEAGLPFRPSTFDLFFHDVAAAKAAPLVSALSLPPPLALQLSSTLVHSKNGWVVLASLRGVTDPASLAAALASAGLPGVAFVDLDHESGQLLHSFQHEATLLALIGSLAILVLLVIGLRSPKKVAMVAAPLAAAVIVTAAFLTLNGGKVSIFMIVGFLLIIAVGSNYCLFFARAEADAEAANRAVASITLANLCTVSAYGLMAFSGIPVLHDIGLTVAIGTFLTLLFAAILSSPALVPSSLTAKNTGQAV